MRRTGTADHHTRASVTRVSLTVDFEPDCPPYLSSTFRGVEQGAPALLDLLDRRGVRATWFTTAEVAERYPAAVAAVVQAGHELGCHGVTQWEIETSTEVLRTFAPVTSFRAPYLRFPEKYVPLLSAAGFTLDSSLAKYKRAYHRRREHAPLTRIPASVTSSVLRLPRAIRDPWLRALADPVVLFVHPWEFVDLRRERLRLDCRFRTGTFALNALREVIDLFVQRGAAFLPMRELMTASKTA